MKHKNHEVRRRFNWESIVQPAIIMFGILGAVIPLHIITRDDIRAMDSKIESNKVETFAMLNGIRQEMKDFHGRLERQDAEFKAHMLHLHKGG